MDKLLLAGVHRRLHLKQHCNCMSQSFRHEPHLDQLNACREDEQCVQRTVIALSGDTDTASVGTLAGADTRNIACLGLVPLPVPAVERGDL
jgi:hypothetical protein